MSHTLATLLLRNLHDVFGEIDPVRRRAAIDEIFHEDAVFYEPKGGIYRGRDEIDRIASVIKASSLARNATSSPEIVSITPSEEPPEIQTDKKEDKVDRAAHGAELRRLDGGRPQEWDRDIRQVKVELHPAADEECAGEEFAAFAVPHRDVERRQSEHDDSTHEIGKHGLLLRFPAVH
jgi:hypothetical protein